MAALTLGKALNRGLHRALAGDPKVVETYMFKLRRKVDRVKPRLIHTLRGRGYSLIGQRVVNDMAGA